MAVTSNEFCGGNMGLRQARAACDDPSLPLGVQNQAAAAIEGLCILPWLTIDRGILRILKMPRCNNYHAGYNSPSCDKSTYHLLQKITSRPVRP